MTDTQPACPTVSIVVPAYNTARYIGGTLASVFAQTYADFEVIVVNDGSPDTPALEEAIAPYRERITYLTQENIGLTRARNRAIEASLGRYVAFLDSDDEWEPEYLAVQVAALDADPSLDVVYPDAILVGDHPHAGRRFMEVCPSEGEVTVEALLTARCNVLISALCRREVLFRAGLFDPEVRSAEDFDLWLRVVVAGGRIGYHDRVLVRFRKRRGSLSSDPVWMAEHALIVLDKAARTLPLAPADLAVLRARQAYFRAALELARGKRAFFQFDTGRAVEHLRKANEFFRSRKLALVCAMMRVTPRLLLRMYAWRDRLVLGADTRF